MRRASSQLPRSVSPGEGYALVADPMRLRQAAGDADLPGVVGHVRVRATATSPSGVFVGKAIHRRWPAFDAARAGAVLGGDGVGYGRSGAAVGTHRG